MENEENVSIKRKKGRPRKTDIIDKTPIIQEKKKRGRKKKEKPIEEPKQKKKRGRKAAVKYFSSSIRKKIPLTTILEDNESNILHLEMNENEVESDVESDVENKEFSLQSAQDLIKQYKEIRSNIENENKILENYISDELTIDKHIESVENEDDISELLENRLNIREKQDTIIKESFESIRKHEVTVNNKKLKDITNNSLEEKRKLGYFNVLDTFFEKQEWLHKTDICCWWCCHQFDTVPIGYPIKYIDKTNKFRSRGIFCSFPCMIAYSKEQKSENKELIKYLFYKLTGLNSFNENLKPAPPRCALKMFGGMLDIDEFRNSIPNNKIYQMIEYPMIIARDYIQEVDLQRIKTVNNTVFNTNDFLRINNLSEKQVEDAKTRVSNHDKNTITTGNTIDKFLKFS
jgi:hypothetical protein